MGWIAGLDGGLQYVPSSYSLSNTHGGHEDLHLHEFEKVANEIIDKKIEIALERVQRALEEEIPNIINQQLEKVAAAYWRGQKYDVDVTAQVALDTGERIFQKGEVVKLLSDRIFNEIKKELEGKTFKL